MKAILLALVLCIGSTAFAQRHEVIVASPVVVVHHHRHHYHHRSVKPIIVVKH